MVKNLFPFLTTARKNGQAERRTKPLVPGRGMSTETGKQMLLTDVRLVLPRRLFWMVEASAESREAC